MIWKKSTNADSDGNKSNEKHKRTKFYDLPAKKKKEEEKIFSCWKRGKKKLLRIVRGLTGVIFTYSLLLLLSFLRISDLNMLF